MYCNIRIRATRQKVKNNMKIVIEIPDQAYKEVKRDIPENLNHTPYELIAKSIRNGTPLPKEHGRLIDADELIKQLEATANIEWNMQVGSSKGLEDAIDIVDDAPTIIDVDKR